MTQEQHYDRCERLFELFEYWSAAGDRNLVAMYRDLATDCINRYIRLYLSGESL